MPFTYAQLRAFNAVARERSFSEAAKRLYVTQPAVTTQVRALEDAYGVSLFDRGGPEVAPTPLGRRLFDVTQRLAGIEEAVEDVLSASRDLASGELSIAAGSPHTALGLVAEFKRRHPAIEVDVALGNYQLTWERLLDRRVDVAVITFAPGDARTMTLPVARHRLLVLLPKRHRLARQPEVALADLAAMDVIFREDTSHTQRVVRDALGAAKVTLHPVLTLGSREAVQEAVANKMGIGFVLEGETGADARVCTRPLADAKGTSWEHVACLKGQERRRVVGAFLDVARDLGPKGPAPK